MVQSAVSSVLNDEMDSFLEMMIGKTMEKKENGTWMEM